MKKYLISENGNFYKANLHCHSNFSDGQLSVDDIKKAYKEQGYSVVAFTDHDIFIPHPELDDEDFLALHGFEVEINENKEGAGWDEIKCCHICAIALDKDTVMQPCWHRTQYLFGNAPSHRNEVKYDENEPDFVREYTGERLSEMMETFRKKGFFVTYNHPAWSMEDYSNYMGYNGMHAMEMVNFGCVAAGYPDINQAQYDDMLRGGKRIYCIAADDNHGTYDRFGGYTMIKAEKLEYSAVTKALSEGNFYCSEKGPAIKSLYVEDGKVTIETENAREIYIVRGVRRAGKKYDESCSLTNATFDIKPNDVYFRLVVVGKDGHCSFTNAYFVDTL